MICDIYKFSIFYFNFDVAEVFDKRTSRSFKLLQIESILFLIFLIFLIFDLVYVNPGVSVLCCHCCFVLSLVFLS